MVITLFNLMLYSVLAAVFILFAWSVSPWLTVLAVVLGIILSRAG